MLVGFGSTGGACYSGWWVWVGFKNTCTVLGKGNVSSFIPKLYGLVYKVL